MGGFLSSARRKRNIVVHFLRKSSCYFFLLLIFLLVVLGGFFWWKINTLPVNKTASESQVFVVRKGESLSSVAPRLEENRLIRSSLTFKILVMAEGLSAKIQAGSFSLSPSLSAQQISLALTHGTADIWLTFPEGWRREEIAQRLSANLENFDTPEFLRLTKNLEGQLFPDTYSIPRDVSSAAVVKILTSNFEKRTQGLKIDSPVLILASIVERESKKEEDRPIVAGILIKRRQAGWPLQADATIQYALGREGNWWPKINKSDLKIDSTYNTYKHKDLPPLPICNPGLMSIKAIVYPQESPFWFYLSDSEGIIHYSRTAEEQAQNMEKYLR